MIAFVGVAAVTVHTTTFLFMVITLLFLPWTFQYVPVFLPQGNLHVFFKFFPFSTNSYHFVWYPYLRLVYIVSCVLYFATQSLSVLD